MPTLKATAGGGAKVEPGTYIVRCMDARQDKLENSQFGNGDVIRIELELETELDGEGNPVQLDAIANMKLTPKSKLWLWAEAFGCKLNVGDDFNTDDLIEKRAQAVIVNKAGTDGGEFSRIENIVPLPRSMGGPAKAPPSVVKADGSADWTAFWNAIQALGANRQIVIAHLGEGANEQLQAMDGPTAAQLLEELQDKANGE